MSKAGKKGRPIMDVALTGKAWELHDKLPGDVDRATTSLSIPISGDHGFIKEEKRVASIVMALQAKTSDSLRERDARIGSNSLERYENQARYAEYCSSPTEPHNPRSVRLAERLIASAIADEAFDIDKKSILEYVNNWGAPQPGWTISDYVKYAIIRCSTNRPVIKSAASLPGPVADIIGPKLVEYLVFVSKEINKLLAYAETHYTGGGQRESVAAFPFFNQNFKNTVIKINRLLNDIGGEFSKANSPGNCETTEDEAESYGIEKILEEEYVDGANNWGAMYIYDLVETLPTERSALGLKNCPTLDGPRLSGIQRKLADGKIFGIKKKKKVPSTAILIDASGSMANECNPLCIQAILQSFPAATIGIYSGHHGEGRLLIVAKKKRVITTFRDALYACLDFGSSINTKETIDKIVKLMPRSAIRELLWREGEELHSQAEEVVRISRHALDRQEEFRYLYQGNVVDGPALRWLISQSVRRKVWITDFGVTGKRDSAVKLGKFECAGLVLDHGVEVFYDVDDFFEGLPLPRERITYVNNDEEKYCSVACVKQNRRYDVYDDEE